MNKREYDAMCVVVTRQAQLLRDMEVHQRTLRVLLETAIESSQQVSERYQEYVIEMRNLKDELEQDDNS
jgi:hypothetical protein